MKYHCEATSIAGFIQQLAVSYVARGYFFYVEGEIPERKDPRVVDERIIEKYGIAIGKAARARRKAAGFANVQYLRFARRFVLLATEGRHRFFDEEKEFIRDVRKVPLKFEGYAVSYRSGHPHVRIDQARYLELKAYLRELALHRLRCHIEAEFRTLPFEPYAPVRSQLHCILREVNRVRALAQFERLASGCIRARRRIVRPFQSESTCSKWRRGSGEENVALPPELSVGSYI